MNKPGLLLCVLPPFLSLECVRLYGFLAGRQATAARAAAAATATVIATQQCEDAKQIDKPKERRAKRKTIKPKETEAVWDKT